MTTSSYTELLELHARFAGLIDHEHGRGVEDLFVADGVYRAGERALNGRDAIRGFYELRHSRAERKSAHVFSSLEIISETPAEAQTRIVLTLYTSEEAPPRSPIPSLVAFFHDLVRRDESGWKFVSRTVVPVFGGLASFIRSAGEPS